VTTTAPPPGELDTTPAPNPYLLGPYAPVATEIDVHDLAVIGDLPDGLHGTYARTGPNPQFPPTGRYHWFDGDGMVHAVRFDDGCVSYANRWVRTDAFGRERDAGAALWRGIMEPLVDNPPDRPLKDASNTDLVAFNGELLSLFYLCGAAYRVDPVTLATRGRHDFGGHWSRNLSAHAKVDERTGELFFFDYGPRPPYLRYAVVDPDGSLAHAVDIDLPGPRLPHDMTITEHYAILMDLPLLNDTEAMRAGRHRIVFDRSLPARYGIIPRRGRGDSIRWFEADPCYVYHSINAYEDGDEVVLDVCRVTKPEPRADARDATAKLLSYLRLDANLHRYRFNLRTGATTEEQLDDDNTEFPTINTGVLGHPGRYAYNVHLSPEPTLLFDGFVKYDLAGGAPQRYWCPPDEFVSEAPFAPRAGGTRTEDDGWLVTFATNRASDTSEVQVFDATDITVGPIARIPLPQRVPLGFHACWVSPVSDR